MFPRLRNTKLTVRRSGNAIVKLLLLFGSIFSLFLMTGLLYFRNDVLISDEGSKKTVYTVSADPYEILRENNIDLGQFDKIEFSGFDNLGDGKTATLRIDRADKIAVMCGGEQIAEVYNIDSTAKQLLNSFKVELGEYDKIVPSANFIPAGDDVIELHRAFDVNITADGNTVTVKCLDNTVQELLTRAEITLGKDDMVSEALDKVITESCDIKVSRVRKESSSKIKTIPYSSSTVTDNLLTLGTTKVRTKGVDGKIATVTTTTYIDGVKADVTKETKVLTKKVDEVIAQGAAVATPYCKIDDPSIVLENGRPKNYEYIISGKATAYTARAGAYTASGRLAEIGTCAVNPNVIPYGSVVYIVGQNNDICYGYAVAADTGDGMMDGSIPVDVYMGDTENHYDDACAWGAQYVDIYVISVGNG